MSLQYLAELHRRAKQEQDTEVQTSLVHTPGSGSFWTNHLFDKQLEVKEDKSLRRVILCSRRAGKTEFLLADSCETAWEYQNAKIYYYAPTREQAAQIVWPKAKLLIKSKKMEAKVIFKEVTKTIVFPNGSEIQLLGADNKADVFKALGTALKKVVIDEAASFGEHLEILVDDVLSPALMDHGGQLDMASTPGYILEGFFYRAWASPNSKWSKHHWTLKDNIKFPLWADKPKEEQEKLYEELLQSELEKQGREITDPSVQRNFFGQWVRDSATLLYDFSTAQNLLDKAPNLTEHPWHLIIGVDLGDNTAFTVVGYHEDSDVAVVFESKVHKYMSISEIGDHLRRMVFQYNKRVLRIVVDYGGLGKMIANEIHSRYPDLPIQAAQKRHKIAFIEVVNSDLRRGKLLLWGPKCGDLITEVEHLQKTEEGEEDPKGINHACDSMLYASRECRHYMTKPKPQQYNPNNPEEWVEHQIKARVARLKRQEREPMGLMGSKWL